MGLSPVREYDQTMFSNSCIICGEDDIKIDLLFCFDTENGGFVCFLPLELYCTHRRIDELIMEAEKH